MVSRSQQPLEVLLEGSTITLWRELAVAFSHLPTRVFYEDDCLILHDGAAKGFLHITVAPLDILVGLKPHPATSLDEGAEMLTTRPMKLKLLEEIPAPDPLLIKEMRT